MYRLEPNKTLADTGKQAVGKKLNKDRLSVVICCNASGSDKVKPLVITRVRKPRCFDMLTLSLKISIQFA